MLFYITYTWECHHITSLLSTALRIFVCVCVWACEYLQACLWLHTYGNVIHLYVFTLNTYGNIVTSQVFSAQHFSYLCACVWSCVCMRMGAFASVFVITYTWKCHWCIFLYITYICKCHLVLLTQHSTCRTCACVCASAWVHSRACLHYTHANFNSPKVFSAHVHMYIYTPTYIYV